MFAPGGSSSGLGLGSKTPAAVTPINAATIVTASATKTRSQIERIGGPPPWAIGGARALRSAA
jgi:hypothetical protein